MKNNLQKTTFDSGVTKDINHKKYFDNENPKRPNDDGRVSSYDDGRVSSYDVDQNDDDSGATSIDENTHIKGNVLDETDLGVKCGVEKVVNYSNLSADNYNFASSLNKSIGPTCYKDAILDKNPLAANGFLRLNTKQMVKLKDLEEYVYITIPQGFSDKNNQNKACKLIKSLDGLKQDLGSLKYFLGIEVIKTGDDISLSRRKYCLELHKEYGLLGCRHVFTPMEPSFVLLYAPTETNPLLDNITGYQKLLGKLIYLTHTRPDIAYSVHCLAQYMHYPLNSHLNCALNVLRYLKNALSKGFKYVYVDCVNNLQRYCDAD
ncbi:ribonuclease H-like domain-containing protein [Tanacetum coccineum]